MAFELSTAKPVSKAEPKGSGFDLSTAKAARVNATPAETGEPVGREPPQGAPAGRFPNARQRGRMDGTGKGDPSVLDYAGDFAGGLNTALFDVADFPQTLMNMGADLTGATALKTQPISEFTGLRQNFGQRVPEVEAQESGVADAGRTFAEWAGAGPLSGGRKFLGAGADYLAGLGAAGGEALFDDTGELVGGLAGLSLPAILRDLPKFLQAGSKNQDAEMALEALESRLTPTEQRQAGVEAEQALARGEEGSLADVTQNPAIAQLEKQGQRNVRSQEVLQNSYDARSAQLSNRFDERLAPDAGVSAPDAAQARIVGALRGTNQQEAARIGRAEDVKAAAEQELGDVRQASQQADTAVGGVPRTDISSRRLSEGYDTLEEQIRKNDVAPAWDRFDEAEEMSTADLKQTLSKFSEDLPAAVRADLNKTHKDIMQQLNSMGDIADPRDIQYVLSAIKSINRNAAAKNESGPLNVQLGEIRNIVDKALRKDEKVGPAFKDAIAATVRQKQRLGGKAVNRARTSDPEVFGDKLNFSGAQGKATVQRIKESESPAIVNRGEAYLRDALRKDGLSEATLKKYGPALDEYPTLRDQASEAVATRQTLEEVEKKASDKLLKDSIKDAKAAGKNRRNKVKGLDTAKFAQKPNEYIRKELNSTDDSGKLGALYQRFTRDGEQYARAFKTKVMNELKDDVLKADTLGNVQGKLDRLADNGIVNTDDVKEISDLIAAQGGRRLRRSASGAGMSTESTGGAMQTAIDDGISTMMALPLLSLLDSGHQLMAAGMFKRTARAILKARRNDPKVEEQLREMLSKPDYYIRALEGKITNETSPEEMQKLFMNQFRRAGIATGQSDDEEG